jgi:hypothetical protein
MAQPGKAQPAAQPAFVAIRRFTVEQQGEPFGVRQRGTGRIGIQLDEGARHAGKPELVQLVDGRMGQHCHSPNR